MITSVALAIDQQVFTSYASIFTQLLMLASVVKIFLLFCYFFKDYAVCISVHSSLARTYCEKEGALAFLPRCTSYCHMLLTYLW